MEKREVRNHCRRKGNTVDATNSIVSGSSNTVGTPGSSTADPGNYAGGSLVVGGFNTLASTSTVTHGYIIGYANMVSGNYSHAYGRGLDNSIPHAMAFGKWNDTNMAADDLIVIGNGTDGTNRSTALTIKTDGSVAIQSPTLTIAGKQVLTATNSANLSSLNVTGSTTAASLASSSLTVSGNSTHTGTTTLTGATTAQALTAASLSVSGTTTLNGTTSASVINAASLNVSGNTVHTGTTTLNGATTLNGTVIMDTPQGDISMGIYE